MKLLARFGGDLVETIGVPGARILDHLVDAGLPVASPCGGRGTCQKCRVRVVDGFVGASAADRQAFAADEIANGWRLACQGIVRGALEVVVPRPESLAERPAVMKHRDVPVEPAAVCDLGTTGVVVALGDREGAAVEAQALNRQARFGADVMTRLAVAARRGVDGLKRAATDTILACLGALEGPVDPEIVRAAAGRGVFVVGNSAMVSLVHGWDTSTLAVAPYAPSRRDSAVLELDHPARFETLPLLAGFIGADTFAGIACLEARRAPVPWMLVDIGTNTEVVLRTADELWMASAPAGPAFEGGNIRAGMRAGPGAICRARLDSGGWSLETIGGLPPRGLCGSGLVDVIAGALAGGVIGRDGRLPSRRLALAPEVDLLADDVREFQLAKSATRTACEILIERAAVRPLAIHLAGNFARHLAPASVERVGLLPPGIPTVCEGNAALAGALVWAARDPAGRAEFAAWVEGAKRPVELALCPEFQRRFVGNLDFP